MTEADIKRVLFGALYLLGSNGEKWGQGPALYAHSPTRRGSGTYCLIESLHKSIELLKLNKDEVYPVVHAYLRKVLNELGYVGIPLVSFNDNPTITFASIKELLQTAIDQIKT